MSALSSLLNQTLRLGEQIAEAAKADDWSRVSELVERRGAAIQQLGEGDEAPDENDLSPAEQRKVDALADQNQRLTQLLREELSEIEEELTQIGQLRQAQDSYETTSPRGGVLPAELSG
jgi:TATA-binding protein-associated factor Taf7